jgi:hypothetical protein
MASYFKKLVRSRRASQQSTGSSLQSYNDTNEKTTGKTTFSQDDGKWASNGAPEADTAIAPGELSFEEDTKGGLGRHLGLFSTTLLM